MRKLSKKYAEFKLTDLPTDEFNILLKPEIQKKLIENAISRFGGWGRFTKLAKHLKVTCKSFKNMRWETINDTLIPLWKKGKRSFSLDCLIELCNLAKPNLDDIESSVIKIKPKIKKIPLRSQKLIQSFIDYFQINKENPVDFVKYFWGITPTRKDLEGLKIFSIVIEKVSSNDYTLKEISRMVKKSKNTLESWLYKNNLTPLVRLLQYFIMLGKPPENTKWLSINSTSGELHPGPWIAVPEKIKSYNDVFSVITQLLILPKAYERASCFNLEKDLQNLKSNMFAYFLGIMLGDASKDMDRGKRRNTARIAFKITRMFKTNERFGEFVCLCANILGLRMERIKDQEFQVKSKYGLYRWVSQSSMLIQWMFNVCLDLENTQTTTYNKISAEWILEAPKEFKKWFIQGLADSDGYIDISNGRMGIISQPNEILIQKIINSLDINSYIHHSEGLAFVVLSAIKAFSIPIFSPFVRSYRFEQLKK